MFQDIIPRIENGELRLIGVARDRDFGTIMQTGLVFAMQSDEVEGIS